MTISPVSKLSVRVYYEDTDAGGIVYHASYIRFAERARSECLREWGVPAASLLPGHGFQVVVRHLTADYFAPAHLDDLLSVESSVIDLGNASFTMDQKIVRDGKAIADLKVVLVCVSKEGKPIRVPEILRSKMEKQ